MYLAGTLKMTGWDGSLTIRRKTGYCRDAVLVGGLPTGFDRPGLQRPTFGQLYGGFGGVHRRFAVHQRCDERQAKRLGHAADGDVRRFGKLALAGPNQLIGRVQSPADQVADFFILDRKIDGRGGAQRPVVGVAYVFAALSDALQGQFDAVIGGKYAGDEDNGQPPSS
jgi:hypothetical protein